MCSDGTLRLGLTQSHYGGTPEAARQTKLTHTMVARRGRRGACTDRRSAGAKRLGCALGGVGLREVVRARLEAVDALLDVLRVRVDGRGHDLGENLVS